MHIFITTWLSKMKTLINMIDIQNGKQAMLCLLFVYLQFRFLMTNTDYCHLLIWTVISCDADANVHSSWSLAVVLV